MALTNDPSILASLDLMSAQLMAPYRNEFSKMLADAMKLGRGAVKFEWHDRPKGYSTSHWRKLKKQVRRDLPVTLKITRQIIWPSHNTGEQQ
jgi:hypothetical protein